MNEQNDKKPFYQNDKQKQDQRSITPPQGQKIITPRRISQFKHTDKEHIINFENYEIISKHKHGILGTLSVIQDKNTKQQYIAKTIKTNNDDDVDKKQQLLSALRKINDIIQFQHPTIVRFHVVSLIDLKGRENITILMDFMKNGSLADIIEKVQTNQLPQEFNNTNKQIILVGISRAMMLLHSHKLINENMKPENVLIDDDYKPHLTDFCLIKIFESGLSKNPCGGTAAYMAPEVITSGILNEKTDVYSFGILMFEDITGTRAYAERSNKGFISATNLLMKVINGF